MRPRKCIGSEKKEQPRPPFLPLPPLLPPSLTSDVILELAAVARAKHIVPVSFINLVADLDQVARFKGGAFANKLLAVLDVVSYLID